MKIRHAERDEYTVVRTLRVRIRHAERDDYTAEQFSVVRTLRVRIRHAERDDYTMGEQHLSEKGPFTPRWDSTMPTESEHDLYFLCQPREPRSSPLPVSFLPVTEFLRDEASCKLLWDLVTHQFHTRSKILAIWSGVRYVALHRDAHGQADGLLLVTTPVNWQIDYVVVRPEARGQGIASALLLETLHQAYLHRAPYVMLTSKPSLRGLYESCGFSVVGTSEGIAARRAGDVV